MIATKPIISVAAIIAAILLSACRQDEPPKPGPRLSVALSETGLKPTEVYVRKSSDSAQCGAIVIDNELRQFVFDGRELHFMPQLQGDAGNKFRLEILQFADLKKLCGEG